MHYKLYGIPNCDTVKKTRDWLTSKNIEYHFHNYKTDSISREKIEEWLSQVPLEKLLNKASATWKGLTDDQKASASDKESAIKIMLENNSIIKRPVLESDKVLAVGFKPEEYENIFK